MDRVKDFEATGIAPNGKLFAGDLNLIQDAAAALSDLTQVLDVGTLRIGETGLTVSKFGTAEAQLAGHLRVTKILRGLEGIIPGAFTTTQRDAIAAGGAPYGLAILNTTKNIWEWNAGTDGARDWRPLGGTGTIVDVLGDRPAGNSVLGGSNFFATDQVVDYVSDGTNWHRKSDPAGSFMLWEGAAAPAGYVLYDGTNLPQSTGIYADIHTHLGGLAKPNWKSRVPVGLDAAQAEFDTLKEMAGAKTHTLSIGEMPSHTHVQRRQVQSLTPGATGFSVDGNGETPGNQTDPTGGNEAHNNLQPYRVCHYIGKL